MGKSKKKSGAGSELRELNLKTAEKWRQWLIKNYEITDSVWLLLHKNKDTDRNLSYEKALEEALCFGWIDSKPRKKDEDSYFVLFSKRNPKSNWSRKNRDTVKLLIKEGRMHKAGLEAVRIAKETGKWEALTDVQNSVIPDDLKQELDANPVAQENFNNFPPSSKRIILEWLLNAKTEATRKKRIQETVILAEKNIRANHYRQPKQK